MKACPPASKVMRGNWGNIGMKQTIKKMFCYTKLLYFIFRFYFLWWLCGKNNQLIWQSWTKLNPKMQKKKKKKSKRRTNLRSSERGCWQLIRDAQARPKLSTRLENVNLIMIKIKYLISWSCAAGSSPHLQVLIWGGTSGYRCHTNLLEENSTMFPSET